MVFKCKMCGSPLELTEGATIATCSYCDTQQTLPNLNSEKCLVLYERANHFRRNNEFDKAMDIYEDILAENPADAEAYWSRILCRYGIEYVEDPETRRQVPTVNRAQYTSVFADEDYKAAIRHAAASQKALYEAEAHQIEEIQKGIISISQKEEPFDVFICYKETDQHGRRTRDSVLAQELYYQLKQEGYKVFFSRITLEDKLGTAYEPYIFAALQSARVMVVIGTKPEHFNAAWVRNEWSRFLTLMKTGHKKMLVPAYRDMDPYDLPAEFSHLQAQDMSKLGFMQDLVRGIKKMAAAGDRASAGTGGMASQKTAAAPNVAPLVKRIFMFLEDGDFQSADEYCEKVLDMDPEIGEVYLAKLMIEWKVRNRKDLGNCENPLDTNHNYPRILRFATEQLKAELEEYARLIQARGEERLKQQACRQAEQKMLAARTIAQLDAVASELERMADYPSAKALLERIASLKNKMNMEGIYQRALRIIIEAANSTPNELTATAEELDAISGYRNAAALAKQARAKAVYLPARRTAESPSATEQDLLTAAERLDSVADYDDAAKWARQARARAEALHVKNLPPLTSVEALTQTAEPAAPAPAGTHDSKRKRRWIYSAATVAAIASVVLGILAAQFLAMYSSKTPWPGRFILPCGSVLLLILVGSILNRATRDRGVMDTVQGITAAAFALSLLLDMCFISENIVEAILRGTLLKIVPAILFLAFLDFVKKNQSKSGFKMAAVIFSVVANGLYWWIASQIGFL